MRFIGVYDYTVILTYMSLFSAIWGMVQASNQEFVSAGICLAICGICDMFDGTVARTKKDRTDIEKGFGIELDSLCDVISFGVFPAILCYFMGVDGIVGIACICFYCMCAVIRLAFFNVLEASRQKAEGGCNKYYRGLPVTSISIIGLIVCGLRPFIPDATANALLHTMLVVVGFLFVLDFKVKKIDISKIFK